MFWFKKSKVVVDCFINSPVIYDLFKIDHAIKFVPEEWKQLQSHIDLKVNTNPTSKLTMPIPTAKRCIAITNQFSTGFVMPMWTDFGLEMFDEGKYAKHDPSNSLQMDNHQRIQYWDTLYKGFSHIKIYSPWLIREKSGVKFTWNQCDWTNTDKVPLFHILSGVVDFQAQHGSHINAFQRKGTIVQYKAGDPMVHIIPITEKDLELKCHLLDDDEYKKMYRSYGERLMHSGQHRAMLKVRRDEQSRCPFRIFGV